MLKKPKKINSKVIKANDEIYKNKDTIKLRTSKRDYDVKNLETGIINIENKYPTLKEKREQDREEVFSFILSLYDFITSNYKTKEYYKSRYELEPKFKELKDVNQELDKLNRKNVAKDSLDYKTFMEKKVKLEEDINNFESAKTDKMFDSIKSYISQDYSSYTKLFEALKNNEIDIDVIKNIIYYLLENDSNDYSIKDILETTNYFRLNFNLSVLEELTKTNEELKKFKDVNFNEFNSTNETENNVTVTLSPKEYNYIYYAINFFNKIKDFSSKDTKLFTTTYKTFIDTISEIDKVEELEKQKIQEEKEEKVNALVRESFEIPKTIEEVEKEEKLHKEEQDKKAKMFDNLYNNTVIKINTILNKYKGVDDLQKLDVLDVTRLKQSVALLKKSQIYFDRFSKTDIYKNKLVESVLV